MTDVPEVLIENLREVLGRDTKPFVLGPPIMKIGTEAAQPIIALFNAAAALVDVADGKPSATFARFLAEESDDD